MIRSPFTLRSVVAHFAMIALFGSLVANPAFAQGAKKATVAPAAKSDQPQQIDKEYTESILKNTTDKQFLTECLHR